MCPFIWDNNVCMPCLSYKSVLIQQMALFMSMLGNNIGRLCVSFCLIIVLSLWHIQLLTSCLLFCGVYILPDFIGGLLGDFHQFYPVGICGVRIVWRHKCGSSAVLLYVFCLNNPSWWVLGYVCLFHEEYISDQIFFTISSTLGDSSPLLGK